MPARKHKLCGQEVPTSVPKFVMNEWEGNQRNAFQQVRCYRANAEAGRPGK